MGIFRSKNGESERVALRNWVRMTYYFGVSSIVTNQEEF
jgi:hypothetical protein